jgi:hypothetical protein
MAMPSRTALLPTRALYSSVTLRAAERMGWLLDEEGRCTGEVVVNRLGS